jgi:two-component system cell cycle sensor histidine kinase/response regulator CckA
MGMTGEALSSFIDAVPHAVVIATERGVIDSANSAAETLFGYAPGELRGLGIEQLVPPELREGHAHLRTSFQATGAIRMHGDASELMGIRKDGTRVSVTIGLAPWVHEGKRYIIACITDNERRRHAELEAESRRHAAIEAGEFSRAIIRDAPIGIVMYDVDSGDCVSANAAATTITGVSHNVIMATPFPDIAAWKQSGMLEAAEEAIITNTPVTRDFEVVTSVGKSLMISASFLVIPLRGRQHLVCMLNDQTARRNLEEQVRVAQKMEAIGQLAGGVAHDFNNLLTVIGTYSSLMMEEFPPGDPKRDDIEEVYSAAKRAATLTRQLLAFGRRQLLDARLINLNDIVGGLEKMLRRVISAEITLDIKLDPELGTIHADAGQMEQAIMNLVVNARDAMPGGGRLTIETMNVEQPPDTDPGSRRAGAGRRRVPRPKVLVRVSDTGVGMDEATIARMFEPFFTTKPAGKGTGLGLATTYGIVKQTGGMITVRSKPGEGAVFELTFRRMSGTASDTLPIVAAADDSEGTGDVLIVEDDDHVRRIVVETLTRRGYTVTAARHGKEALEIALARERAPDLVVTDIIMPEMNGRELVRRLRERWPDVRVLFTTAYAVDEVTGTAATDLAGNLLRKPFIPSELGSAVREALG